jgi:ubiquinone/menaquinone biosynthesis C-methylase UbiE
MNQFPISIEKCILDLGCGEGHIGDMLFNKIDIGLDLTRDEVKKARELPVYKNVVTADAKRIPFSDRTFDIVFSNSVIEHIPGIEQVLSEVSRVLRREGLFIFTVPSHKFSDYLYFTTFFKKIRFSIFGLSKIYPKLRNRQLNHYNLFDDVKWEKLLKQFSLSVVYKKYYLSHKDIYEWDRMCILLRIIKPLRRVQKILINKLNKKVKQLLENKDNLTVGAGLLIVAEKKIP